MKTLRQPIVQVHLASDEARMTCPLLRIDMIPQRAEHDGMASLSLRFGHSGVSGELSRYTLFVFFFFSFRDITIGNSTSPTLRVPTLFSAFSFHSTFITHNRPYCIPTSFPSLLLWHSHIQPKIPHRQYASRY